MPVKCALDYISKFPLLNALVLIPTEIRSGIEHDSCWDGLSRDRAYNFLKNDWKPGVPLAACAWRPGPNMTYPLYELTSNSLCSPLSPPPNVQMTQILDPHIEGV